MAPKERGGRGGQARRGVYLILTALTERTFIWVNERAGQIPLPRKCFSWQKVIWDSQVGSWDRQVTLSPGMAQLQDRKPAVEIRTSIHFTFFSFSLTFHVLVGNHMVTSDAVSLNNKPLDSSETLLPCPSG